MTARRYITLKAERDRLLDLDLLTSQWKHYTAWLERLSSQDLSAFSELNSFASEERDRAEEKYPATEANTAEPINC